MGEKNRKWRPEQGCRSSQVTVQYTPTPPPHATALYERECRSSWVTVAAHTYTHVCMHITHTPSPIGKGSRGSPSLTMGMQWGYARPCGEGLYLGTTCHTCASVLHLTSALHSCSVSRTDQRSSCPARVAQLFPRRGQGSLLSSQTLISICGVFLF